MLILSSILLQEIIRGIERILIYLNLLIYIFIRLISLKDRLDKAKKSQVRSDEPFLFEILLKPFLLKKEKKITTLNTTWTFPRTF